MFNVLFPGSGMFTPVTITPSSTYPGALAPGAAVHQLPTVISKPKIVVSNGTQLLYNGPGGLTTLANGATHLELKSEQAVQNPCEYFYQLFIYLYLSCLFQENLLSWLLA